MFLFLAYDHRQLRHTTPIVKATESYSTTNTHRQAKHKNTAHTVKQQKCINKATTRYLDNYFNMKLQLLSMLSQLAVYLLTVAKLFR